MVLLAAQLVALATGGSAGEEEISGWDSRAGFAAACLKFDEGLDRMVVCVVRVGDALADDGPVFNGRCCGVFRFML